YQYLGLTISNSVVCPQKLHLRTDIRTLHDVQKLIGDLQWIRPYCGITNDDLSPLLQLLKEGGGADA
ncbi:POK6 protein, partial [Piaya cayana]|nr:POK6 protein [Piaya cayana]